MNRIGILAAVVAAGLLLALAGARAREQDAASTKTKNSSGTYQKPSEAELKKKLTPLQYHVTQEGGTESAFANEYWDNHRPGIYVDVVSGEVLFSSADKFESGTGWPSFTKPLEPDNLKKGPHSSIDAMGAEVRSAHADSHLGHVFADGPPPTGLRYCMNSAAMRFIPADKLAEEGYGKYAALFEKKSEKK